MDADEIGMSVSLARKVRRDSYLPDVATECNSHGDQQNNVRRGF